MDSSPFDGHGEKKIQTVNGRGLVTFFLISSAFPFAVLFLTKLPFPLLMIGWILFDLVIAYPLVVRGTPNPWDETKPFTLARYVGFASIIAFLSVIVIVLIFGILMPR